MIDYNNLIQEISLQDGEFRTVGAEFFQNRNGEFDEIKDLWKLAGYNNRNVEWVNYYADQHFDKQIIDQFAKMVNLKHARSWISKIRPGKHAPWHWDVDDKEEEYQNMANNELVRYSCFISKPQTGHVFILEDICYHMQPQGTLIKWPSYKSWHAGTNLGLTPKYMFHFLGYK